jgi:hypothetical protein
MHFRAVQLDGTIHLDPAREGTHHFATTAVLEEWGYVQGYRTTASVEEAISWMGHAPVLFATVWHVGHLEAVPGKTPNKRYVPDGAVYNSHEFVCYAYDKPDLLCQNSWGKGFADNGRFRLNKGDAQRIMNEQGTWGTALQPFLIFLTPIRGAF